MRGPGLLARRPGLVVAVALANKTACVVWAVMAKGQSYRQSAPA
jgi:transposase